MTTERQTPERDDRDKQTRRTPSPDRPLERTERPHPGTDRPGENDRPQREGTPPQHERR
jgi:hypothetical protein